MSNAVLPKGMKLRMVREVIAVLGPDVKHAEAQKWLQQKYSTADCKIADSTFYHERDTVRRRLQAEGERQRIAETDQQRQQELLKLQEFQRQREAGKNNIVQEERLAAAQEAKRLRAELHNMTPSQEVATRMLEQGEIPATPDAIPKISGISILVKAAKVLVTRLGKDEAKLLIDAL
jgi:hypothetical protein